MMPALQAIRRVASGVRSAPVSSLADGDVAPECGVVEGDGELGGLSAVGWQLSGAQREATYVNQRVGAAGGRGAQVGAAAVPHRCGQRSDRGVDDRGAFHIQHPGKADTAQSVGGHRETAALRGVGLFPVESVAEALVG